MRTNAEGRVNALSRVGEWILVLFIIGCHSSDPHPSLDGVNGNNSVEDTAAEGALAWEDGVLGLGDKGSAVESVYRWLTRYGYFPSETLAGMYPGWTPIISEAPVDPSVFDEALAAGVSAFQGHYGLEQTGEVDVTTLEAMTAPRCGFPDGYSIDPAAAASSEEGTPPPWSAGGGTWPSNSITWRYGTQTADLSETAVVSALGRAVALWSAVTPLDFSQTTGTPDIDINFGTVDPATGFDPATTLGYAFSPPNGDILMNDATFHWQDGTHPDVCTVAGHEAGHAIGLGHSDDRTALMFASLGSARCVLAADDVAGAQALYGQRYRWESLGTSRYAQSVIANLDGRLEVFATDSSGLLYHAWQASPGAGPWSWESMLYHMSDVSVAQNADGRLEVFGVGADGLLWHRWQTAAGSGWSDWESMQWLMTEPAVARNADGRLELFAVGGEGLLYHRWQTSANGAWSDWESMLWQMHNPFIATNADGRLEVFAVGNDGVLAHKWQVVAGGGWSDWEQLGAGMSAPAVGRNADGRLEVFAVSSDGYLYHRWQVAAGSGPWSDWESMLWQMSAPFVASNADGRLELFAIGNEGHLYHRWQNAPNSDWSDWEYMGMDAVSGPVVAMNPDGRLEVFITSPAGELWHAWQSQANGAWN